jgi:uncharacterized phiE125 gp8 family phage protein
VLDLPPVQSVTSITYLDPEGVLQTWSSTEYLVDLARGWVLPTYATVYPATRAIANAVTVRFVTGLAAPAVAPADKQLIRWLVAYWHEQREPVGPGATLTPLPLHLSSAIDLRRDWRVA